MAVVVLLVVMLLVASIRKGSVATISMTARRIKLHTVAPPDMVYTWLTQHCPSGNSVEDHDAARGIVILPSQPTVFTADMLRSSFSEMTGRGTPRDRSLAFRVGSGRRCRQ
ncbi:hypothetical protein [Amycolatopsis keratiniphila]|uniref:hypothetical protein n=1 Tax=Amycolatopsis keratiniphila TaxID=129921 RepID=UPI0003A3D66E|nr:hypothetical protein [Amycolatopsis keratiniphila]